MARGKGDIKGWITKNGVHIPIYGEYTVRGGVEPKAKGAKWKKRFSAEGVKKALNRNYDADSNETWYEGKINGKDVRITQENAGSNKFWNVDIGKPGDRHKLLTDNNEPMSFKSLEDAHEEIAHELNSNSGQDSVASKGKKDKYADRDWNKDVDDAKRYGYSEQTEEGKKPVTKAEEEKQARQSFRDKKAQEQGFADDASMRSYNEETGVNAETWKSQTEEEKKPSGQHLANVRKGDFKGYNREAKIEQQINDRFKTKKEWDEIAKNAGYKDSNDPEFQKNADDIVAKNKQASSKATPESYAQSKGKSIRDIAQEVNNNDAARAQANQLMKDGRTYEEAAALAHSDMERGVLKGQESSTPTIHETRLQRQAVNEKAGLKSDRNQNFKTAYQNEGSSTFSPESSAQTINDMQRRRANGGGKNDDWKTAQSVLESAPAGTTMIQTGNRGVKFQYTKGQDGTWHSSAGSEYDSDSKKLSMSWVGDSGPRVEFTTSDKALSGEQIKASHTAATSGRLNQALGLDRNNRPIGNRSTRKVDTSTSTRTEKQDSLSASMNERSRIRGELHAKDKAMKATMPTTVSGLRSAYADATGSMKSKIAAELRRKGYSLVGGKWVKGRKE